MGNNPSILGPRREWKAQDEPSRKKRRLQILRSLTTDKDALDAWNSLYKLYPDDLHHDLALQYYKIIIDLIEDHVRLLPISGPSSIEAKQLANSLRLVASKLTEKNADSTLLDLIRAEYFLTMKPIPTDETSGFDILNVSLVFLLKRKADLLDILALNPKGVHSFFGKQESTDKELTTILMRYLYHVMNGTFQRPNYEIIAKLSSAVLKCELVGSESDGVITAETVRSSVRGWTGASFWSDIREQEKRVAEERRKKNKKTQ